MATEVTRKEHMDWCKKRSHEFLESGDTKNAFTSMISDLSKHSETRSNPAIMLGMNMFSGGMLDKKDEMKKFINGFS